MSKWMILPLIACMILIVGQAQAASISNGFMDGVDSVVETSTGGWYSGPGYSYDNVWNDSGDAPLCYGAGACHDDGSLEFNRTLNETTSFSYAWLVSFYNESGDVVNETILLDTSCRKSDYLMLRANLTTDISGAARYGRYYCFSENETWVLLLEENHGYAAWIMEEGLMMAEMPMNITFYNSTSETTANGSIIWSNGSIVFSNTTITEWIETIEGERAIIEFSEYGTIKQRIEFKPIATEANSVPDENVYLFNESTEEYKIKVWDGAAVITGARVWLYRPLIIGGATGDGEDYLVYGGYTNEYGEMIAELEPDYTYRINIIHKDYNERNEILFLGSSTDSIIVEMTKSETTHITPSITITCDGNKNETRTCTITAETDYSADIDINLWMNGTTWINNSYTGTTSETYQFGINTSNLNTTAYIYINSELIQTRTETLETYATDIVPGETLPTDQEAIFDYVLIVLIGAAAIAAIGNRLIEGSGIYIFGGAMAIMNLSIDMFWIPLIAVSLLTVKIMADKIFGEK